MFRKYFEDLNFTVKYNEPFKGSIVPLKYLNKNKNVQSIMIEVRRDLYMNEKTGKKIRNFKKIKDYLNFLIKQI